MNCFSLLRLGSAKLTQEPYHFTLFASLFKCGISLVHRNHTLATLLRIHVITADPYVNVRCLRRTSLRLDLKNSTFRHEKCHFRYSEFFGVEPHWKVIRLLQTITNIHCFYETVIRLVEDRNRSCANRLIFRGEIQLKPRQRPLWSVCIGTITIKFTQVTFSKMRMQ